MVRPQQLEPASGEAAGNIIAFYSNRANKLNEATRQIWVMDIVNDQGANLRNLSNRPDMVDTDPVWFKWPPP